MDNWIHLGVYVIWDQMNEKWMLVFIWLWALMCSPLKKYLWNQTNNCLGLLKNISGDRTVTSTEIQQLQECVRWQFGQWRKWKLFDVQVFSWGWFMWYNPLFCTPYTELGFLRYQKIYIISYAFWSHNSDYPMQLIKALM